MIGFDLRKYGTLDLSFYLALEAYLINRNDDNDYFFLWDIDKSIIVGINQLVETEVNLDFVRKNDFKVYRRPSGGGAIYADSGDFMFTFLTNKKSKDEMFNYSLDKIRSVLSSLGLDVSKSGRNDLTYLDKKFSGSAIYYKNNKTILHGTFLYDASLDNLEKFLTPSSNKLISKGISSVKSRVINLKEYLNGMTKDELMKYFLYHIDEDIKVKNLDQEDFDKVMVIKNKYDDDNNTGDEDLEIFDNDYEESDENTQEEVQEEVQEEIQEINEENSEADDTEEQIINTNDEEDEEDANIVINAPIAVNTNEKDKEEETLKTKKIKKNSATWEIITDEEIQLEQWQDNPDSEDDEDYQPTAEELFEYEPEFFADDELSQQFRHLVQNVRGIFKLERNDWEQNPYFKILWWKTGDSTLEYLFYLIEEEDEPIDLYIKKVETQQNSQEETEHLVQFSYNENKELNIFVDEVILYERINKSDSNTPEYNDTKAILEKFIFLTDNHYDKLNEKINKEREEKKKKRQLQQIFKGF